MGKLENTGYLRNCCNQWPENLKVQTTNSVNESEYWRSLSRSFLGLVFSRFCIFCAYKRPRYQVSVYRTIGPLVNFLPPKQSSTSNLQ